MNPAKIIIHKIERQSVLVVLQFLTEPIGQSRESAHRHSHREILTLRVARRNVVVIGIAANDGFSRPHADCRAVTSYRRRRREGQKLRRAGEELTGRLVATHAL